MSMGQTSYRTSAGIDRPKIAKQKVKDAKLLDNIKYIEMSENKSKATWNVIKHTEKISKPVKSNTLNQFLIDSVKDEDITERLPTVTYLTVLQEDPS